VQHPNCLQLFECYVTTKKVYMVTELVSGGQLLNRIVEGGLGEGYSAHVMRQVLHTCGRSFVPARPGDRSPGPQARKHRAPRQLEDAVRENSRLRTI